MKRSLLIVIAALALPAVASAHHTPTREERAPTEDSALRQAGAVVAGHFTGEVEEVEVHRQEITDDGYVSKSDRIARVGFEVEEVLDGIEVPERLDLMLEVDEVAVLPEPGERVVLGTARLHGLGAGRYALVHGQVFEAGADAQLASLRARTLRVREGVRTLDAPPPPEDLLDSEDPFAAAHDDLRLIEIEADLLRQAELDTQPAPAPRGAPEPEVDEDAAPRMGGPGGDTWSAPEDSPPRAARGSDPILAGVSADRVATAPTGRSRAVDGENPSVEDDGAGPSATASESASFPFGPIVGALLALVVTGVGFARAGSAGRGASASPSARAPGGRTASRRR